GRNYCPLLGLIGPTHREHRQQPPPESPSEKRRTHDHMFLSSSERADYQHDGNNESRHQRSSDDQTDVASSHRPISSLQFMVVVFRIHTWRSIELLGFLPCCLGRAYLLALSGRVLSRDCRPIAGARLDFWQAEASGSYDNAGYRLRGNQTSESDGRYALDTVVPGEYPGRTEHIHVKVQPAGGGTLTTQL